MAGDDEQLWDRRFAEKEWISTPDPLLVELVGPLPPGRALDVASGPGRNSLWLAGSGWEVTALDSSAVALRQAVARAAAAGLRLQTVQADVVTWRPPATAYDLVIVANLHLPTVDLTSLLTRLGEVLRPGGHPSLHLPYWLSRSIPMCVSTANCPGLPPFLPPQATVLDSAGRIVARATLLPEHLRTWSESVLFLPTTSAPARYTLRIGVEPQSAPTSVLLYLDDIATSPPGL